MSKVIHQPNFKSSHLSKFNSLLHRGQKSKDPYNNRRLSSLSSVGLLLKTLGTDKLSTRCSSTFSGYINNSKNLRIAGFSSAFILLILSALSIYPIVRNLNLAEAATPTNSTTTLSITSSNSASVELLVKSDSGTFASSTSSQKLNFNVKTDNYAGYELTLLGKDSTYNELKNSSTNTTLTSIATSSTITSSSFANGNWGYTLDGTNYRAAPNNTTGYQIEKTSTPNKDTAKTYTLGIGAKANYSTKAGTYTNTYVLTAVGNSTPYTIYYKDNTNDSSVANLPTTQDEATSAININLSDTIPTRTGYTFSKWCDGTVTENGTKCSGTQYSASASFGIDRTAASNVTTLYAVWTVNSYTLNITNNNTTSNPASLATINFGGETTITVTPNAGYYLSEVSCPTGYTCSSYSTGSDATGAQTVTVKNNGNSTSATGGTITFTAESSVDGYMQDFTADECSALSDGTTLKLGDKRDGNTYNVTKINGNCWMTQNLRYVGDTGSTSGSMIMKSATSNISTDITISYSDLTEGNSYGAAILHVATSDQVPSGATFTAMDMGVWYNYVAASAMTITGASNTTVDTYNICPKNWTMPTNSQQSGIASATYKDAFSPVTGGRYYSGSVHDTGYGYWWSATAYNGAFRDRLYYDGSNLHTSFDDRYYGVYVRCVRKTALEELQSGTMTMQAIGSMDASSLSSLTSAMTTNTAYTVVDSRDSQSYNIGKLGDGRVWMTRNLAIGCNGAGASYSAARKVRVLTSEDSDVLNYITPDSPNFSTTFTEGRIVCDGTYGAWYNYYAASAGTISGNNDATEATSSVCPKGWRLPTYSELANIPTSSSFYPVAGGYYESAARGDAKYGYWWSATARADASRYFMSYNGSNLSINDGGRGLGLYVRCILKAPIESVEYLQDMTSSMASSVANGWTGTLKDKRDGNSYSVAKINGNLWMTQNLRYVGDTGSASGSMVMKAITSNISADKTVSYEDLTAGNSYDAAKLHVATSNQVPSGATYTATDMGVWYNYAAASAMTITGSSNSTVDTYNICPKNWTLPTGNSSGQFGTIASYKDAFFPVTGGLYNGDSVLNAGYGYWWSATAFNTMERYLLYYNGSRLDATGIYGRGAMGSTSGVYCRERRIDL